MNHCWCHHSAGLNYTREKVEHTIFTNVYIVIPLQLFSSSLSCLVIVFYLSPLGRDCRDEKEDEDHEQPGHPTQR